MEQGRWTAVVAVLAGLWLLIAPMAYQFTQIQTAFWNDLIVGLSVVVLAGGRAMGVFRDWASYALIVLGIWQTFSGLFLGFSTNDHAMFNSLLMGLLIGFMGFWSALVVHVPGPAWAPVRTRGPVFVGAEPTEEERRQP